jgi:hypothetical protein
MARDSWVEVAISQGWAEALVIKGLLESNGIPVRLGYEALGSILGLTMDGLGEVKVMVPRDKTGEAGKLLSTDRNLQEEMEK